MVKQQAIIKDNLYKINGILSNRRWYYMYLLLISLHLLTSHRSLMFLKDNITD